MSDVFSYDTRRLDRLIAEMSPRRRASLMRSATRKSANDVKRRAGAILLSRLGHVSNRKAARNTICTIVARNQVRFSVTVASRRKNLYPSRMKGRGGATRMLPLGLWWESGADGHSQQGAATDQRRTRKGAYARGVLPSVGMLSQAWQELSPGMVRRMEAHMVKQLEKIAKKYQ